VTDPARATLSPQSDLDLLSGWLSQTAEVERSTARFTTLARTAPVGVLLVTRGGVTFANDHARRLVGDDPERLPLSALRRFLPDAQARAAVRAALADGWRGRDAVVDTVVLTRSDGSTRLLSLAVRPLTREQRPTLLIVATEPPPARETVPAGPSAQDSLRVFGMYLAAVASDLRGPLSASLDHLAALTERADLTPELREAFRVYRDVTEDTLARMARAMEWGRRSLRYEPTDLRDIVEAAVGSLDMATFPGAIDLQVRLDAGAVIPGACDQLHLAVEHVLRNACEALAPRGGKIDVELLVVGGGIALSVRDTGPGIPPSLFPHVLEPFSSTKSVVTGLGLGLAIVQDIVRRHRGEVSIDSGPQGTTVTLAFATATEAAGATGSRSAGSDRRKPRALLVDDDVSLREVYRVLLERAGWEVTQASDSDRALQVAAMDPVDAILVDVQMSGRDGVAIVEALATWHPHLVDRVILHTGYAEEERVRTMAARYGLPVIQKPCKFAVLLKLLQDLAARAGAPGKPGGAVG
jgi:signal transduction histidine kinase/CheY-like chemotaxis protein